MKKFILTSALKSFFLLTSMFLVMNFLLRVVSCEEEVSEVAVAEVVSDEKIVLIEEHKSYLATPKNTFLYYCAPCHGDKGDGKGIYFTIDLKPKPTDLTNVDYMAKLTDDYLLNFVKSGSAAMEKSDLCPPWGGTFDEERIKVLIGYLRTLTIAKSSGETKAEGAVDVLAATSSGSDEVKKFTKWGVLILLCLIFMFAARKEWQKLRAESESKKR